jgi:hypothetical protein
MGGMLRFPQENKRGKIIKDKVSQICLAKCCLLTVDESCLLCLKGPVSYPRHSLTSCPEDVLCIIRCLTLLADLL